MREQTKEKVYVGLSGGVDSAVAAALLKQAGYEVVGVFIDVWQPDFVQCPMVEDRRDAMRVAAALGIAFKTLDCRERYRAQVVDDMLANYARGRTPNPDTRCNGFVKFGVFYEQAVQAGAVAVATGHYAGVADYGPDKVLTEGADPNKDQSYFLWRVESSRLSSLLFPLANLDKGEVRELAEEFGLPVADKKDSQGVCFLGPVEMKEFLGKYLPVKLGPVIDQKGRPIGQHEGAWFYTLGQRHGFSVTDKAPDSGPMYVIDLSVEENVLVVSTDRSAAGVSGVKLSETNWFSDPLADRLYTARVRYRGEKYPCRIKYHKTGMEVKFLEDRPLAVTGQSLVVYDGNYCLGGGVIERR